jgi:hypothetical protein
MPKDPIKSFIFQDDGTFPNNPLPLLVLNQAFDADLAESEGRVDCKDD